MLSLVVLSLFDNVKEKTEEEFMSDFRETFVEIVAKDRERLKLALLSAGFRVFPICTFPEMHRIIFGLLPRLLRSVYEDGGVTMKTNEIVLDLFLKVLKLTKNTADIEMLARQLVALLTSSKPIEQADSDSNSTNVFLMKSLCSALSIVSTSLRPGSGSKNRAEGALSAAILDTMRNISWESTEQKRVTLQETLELLMNSSLFVAKQIRLEIEELS